jgi:thioredoxin-like negative regulator of GroEL
MGAFMGEVLEEFNPFSFYKMDRDEFQEISSMYKVMGIPSLLVFKEGEKIGHLHSANAKTPESVTEFLTIYFGVLPTKRGKHTLREFWNEKSRFSLR